MKRFYDNERLSHIKDLIRDGHFDLAEEEIEDYKMIYPKDVIICKYYARLLFAKGLYREAEKECLYALSGSFHVKRLKSDIYITLSEIFTAQDKTDDAIEALKKAYELKENNTQTIQIRLANLYMKKQNKEKAMDILSKQENNMLNKNLELQKAAIYISEKEYELALKILLDINDMDLKNKNDVQRKNIYIGSIYKQKKELEKALYYYSNALIVKNEYYWHAYHDIGHIKYKLGYIDEAINILEETVKRFKTDLVLESLIKCYLLKGNNTRVYELINEIKDNYVKELFLGRLNCNNQKYEEAEKIFTNMIMTNNETRYYYYAIYYLVISKFRLNKYEEVLELIDKYEKELCYSDRYKREMALMRFLTNKELGNDVNPTNYSEKQVLLYSEELAINHIKNHHDTDYKISKFNDDIDIEHLYYYIRGNLDINKRIIYGALDKYTIDFSKDMGNDEIRNLRSVSAICLPDTNNILTMYPDKYEQIQEEIEENTKTKVRRLSQIEKFNKRYKK